MKNFSERLLILSAALWVAGCGGSKPYAMAEISTPPSEKRVELKKATGSLGVLPFENTTKKPELDWWEQGLTDMLTTDFAGVEGLQVVERRQRHKVLEEAKLSLSGLIDESTAKKVGKLMGVDMVVTGSVAAVGGQVRVDARVLHVETGKVLGVQAALASHQEVRLLLGMAWRDKGEHGFARKELEALAAMDALNHDVHRELSWLYQAIGEWEKAIKSAQTAWELYPEDVEALYALAEAYKGKGDGETAKMYFQKVLEKNPVHEGAKAGLEE